jgi:hypothetical protein
MTQGLSDFLSRIQTDYGFYLLFRQNPQAALGPYPLSAQERTVLSESGVDVGNDPRLPLRARLLNTGTNTTSLRHFLVPELGDLGFDATAAVARVEIKRSLTQLSDAGSLNERLAVLETLMKYIG